MGKHGGGGPADDKNSSKGGGKHEGKDNGTGKSAKGGK